MNNENTVTVRKGREKPIRNRHPWIFSGALAADTSAAPGEVVTVRDHQGDFLARGYWNPRSQIQVRILTWQDEPVDEDWWRRGLERAIHAREPWKLPEAGQRLVNAENDYLPGLIIDRYRDYLVLQALTLHIDQHKGMLARLAMKVMADAGAAVKGVYERSDVDVRGKEGLEAACGLLTGQEPPELVVIDEAGRKLPVDLRRGHKTGTYLDQAENRVYLRGLIEALAADGQPVRLLNLFSYTGAFGLHAQPLAHVTHVDVSGDALAIARHSAALNGIPPENTHCEQADVFDYLRACLERDESPYEVIVLDPPKFAHNRGQVQRAARGYKDINMNAFKLVKPGGYLMTFSCSGAIDADLFQKIVFGAMVDSGRHAQIIRHLGASGDHPTALTFPEGAYLKGLLLRVY